MAADGRVGAVGGIATKAATAQRLGAAIFLVPASQVVEAVSAAPGLRVVGGANAAGRAPRARVTLSAAGRPQRCMVQCTMRRRTQLYLDEDQYRWLKRQAGQRGTIAAVVRELIDTARARATSSLDDPFIRLLIDEPAVRAKRKTSVRTLDDDLYGR